MLTDGADVEASDGGFFDDVNALAANSRRTHCTQPGRMSATERTFP